MHRLTVIWKNIAYMTVQWMFFTTTIGLQQIKSRSLTWEVYPDQPLHCYNSLLDEPKKIYDSYWREKLIQFNVIWKLEWISLEQNQVFFCSQFQLLLTIPAPSLFLACQLQKLTISQLGNCPIQQNQTPQHPTCLTSQEIICQLQKYPISQL